MCLRPMRQTLHDAWDAQDRNLQSVHTRSDAIVGDTSTNVCKHLWRKHFVDIILTQQVRQSTLSTQVLPFLTSSPLAFPFLTLSTPALSLLMLSTLALPLLTLSGHPHFIASGSTAYMQINGTFYSPLTSYCYIQFPPILRPLLPALCSLPSTLCPLPSTLCPLPSAIYSASSNLPSEYPKSD